MMNDRILLYCSCLFFGFLVGRATVVEKEIVKHVKGETIRDTIMLKADTVKIPREINLKPALVKDDTGKDIPVMDSALSVKETIKDWNLTRSYKKTLFDNESGKLSIDLSVRYNELKEFSYSFTPVHKETTVIKKRVFTPFISTSCTVGKYFSAGGGFFYHDIGLRAEWSSRGLNIGLMYKF